MSTKSSPTKTASTSKPPAKAKAAKPVTNAAKAPVAPAKAAKTPAPKTAKASVNTEAISLQAWITEIREQSPEEFKDIPDEQMLRFIRNVFRQVCTCLEENNDGLIKVAGLGQFRISQSGEPDGKRITFRLPAAKQAGD